MDENLIGNILGSLINRDNDCGMGGGNGAWWIIILLLFFTGGFGGFGMNRGLAAPATQQDVAAGFNFNQLDNGIRGLERGMCQLGYDNLAQANGINMNVNAQGDAPTCSTITNTFAANNYDLILANATPALLAAISSTSSIPILGTSVTDYATAMEIDEWTGVTGTNVSGTSDLAPLDQQAACIKELFPDAKNIGILYCSAEPNSKYQATVITEYLEKDGYTVTEYKFSDSNDVASVTQAAADANDVLYIPTDNTAASCTEAIANVVIPAKVPVFAGEEGICAGCGIATLSISYYDLGRATGDMAYEILVNGADPASMEIEFAPNVTKKYNAANAEALGITIPDDYEAIEE